MPEVGNMIHFPQNHRRVAGTKNIINSTNTCVLANGTQHHITLLFRKFLNGSLPHTSLCPLSLNLSHDYIAPWYQYWQFLVAAHPSSPTLLTYCHWYWWGTPTWFHFHSLHAEHGWMAQGLPNCLKTSPICPQTRQHSFLQFLLLALFQTYF